MTARTAAPKRILFSFLYSSFISVESQGFPEYQNTGKSSLSLNAANHSVGLYKFLNKVLIIEVALMEITFNNNISILLSLSITLMGY